MRTLQNLFEFMRIERSVGQLPFNCLVKVVVLYNRKQYRFFSDNLRACYRIDKQEIVSDRVNLYGYTLKGAYLAFYCEFKKRRAVGEIDVI